MVKWLIFLFSLALFHTATAQNKTVIQGTVSGTLKDSLSKQPLEKATVRLTVATRNNRKKAVVTDSLGNFSFQNVPADTYVLTIEFVGYHAFLQKDIIISENHPDVVLNDIYL